MSGEDRFHAISILSLIFVGATVFAGAAYDAKCEGMATALVVVAGASVISAGLVWLAGKVFLP